MDGWTVIPRWLYENDLPDVELQEVYVREAEAKWRQCVEARRDAEASFVEARLIEVRAKQFLEDARAALEKYRQEAQEAGVAPARPKRIGPPRRRALPRPRSDG